MCVCVSVKSGSAQRGIFLLCQALSSWWREGEIKDLHPLTTKCYRFVEPPSALATGTAYLSLASLTLCLSWSSGTCEAFMREWVLTAETDVTRGRAGTVNCQPLSCPRQCSLRWIRKSLIDIWTELKIQFSEGSRLPKSHIGAIRRVESQKVFQGRYCVPVAEL